MSLRHLTERMSELIRVGMPAASSASRTSLARRVSSPDTSPRVIEPLLVCLTRPGSGMSTPTTATPGSTGPSPSTSSSTASLSTPFWRARTVVCAFTMGRTASAASRVSVDLTVNSTRSTGPMPEVSPVALMGASWSSPAMLSTRSPEVRSAFSLSPRVMNQTS